MLIPVLLLWPRWRKGVWWCKADVCIWVHDIPCGKGKKILGFLNGEHFCPESTEICMSNFRIIQQFCAYFRASNKIIIKILSYLFLILWQIGVFDINCYTIAFLRTKDLTKSCSIKKKKKKLRVTFWSHLITVSKNIFWTQNRPIKKIQSSLMLKTKRL